jgi:23S rRNA (cytidine1920-2'-O)/16S rRNA (cytidine1409-2'-O)-methyltransferase
LDQSLVERGHFPSREQAQRAIMSGLVRVNGQPARKPSDSVHPEDNLQVDATKRYVSRGGQKLEHALVAFQIEIQGKTAVDLGASTGGFTDCLLQRGAKLVYAVDVGRGQLAWKLRSDPRVVVMEKVNARNLTAARMPPLFSPVDLAVLDCSFISLRMILPAAIALTRADGTIVALVKPQFEAGKAEADRGAGVITDPAVHERILHELREFVEADLSALWRGFVPSPLLGPAGNREFLAYIKKHA